MASRLRTRLGVALGALAVLGGGLALLVADPLSANQGSDRSEVARALALLDAGNATAARDAAVAAVRSAPDWGLAHAVHARTLVALGDGVGAEGALGRAFASGFAREQGQALLGEAQLLRGAPDRALATLAAAPPRYAAYAARVRGRALSAMNRNEEAARAFAESRRLAPDSAWLWLDVARHNAANGDVGDAILASARAVALDSRQPDILLMRALMVRTQFGPVAALPWFERALARDPAHSESLFEQAATLGEAGRTIEMLAAVRRAMRVRADPRGYYLQAVLAARAGDYATARGVLQKIGTAIDAVPGAVMLAGSLDLEAGSHQQAIERLRLLVDRQPANIAARRLLASAYLRADASRDAIALLTPMVERSDADSESLLLAARGYERIGDRANAALLADRAASPSRGEAVAFASHTPLPELLADAQRRPGDPGAAVALIRALLTAGDGRAALSRAQALAAARPGMPEAHLAVGDVQAQLGNPGEALVAYRAAASLRFDEGAMLRLVDAGERAGQPEEAARTLALFLSQNPINVPALRLAAKWQIASGEYDAAIEGLEQARLRLGNRDAGLLAELAIAHAGAGEVERARLYARAAYALAPANPAVADAYGWALLKDGEPARAAALLAKAARIAPGHSVIRWHLAQALAASGDRAGAAVHARAALADPRFTDREEAEALARKS